MRTLLAVIVHLGILQTCLAKCYYPGGKEATGDVPCDPDAEVSPCCGGTSELGFACLSNKLCLSPKGFLARGSCTDPTWNSPDCPKYCMSETGRGWDLISCANVSQSSYCCDGEAGCCDSGHGRFDINPGQPLYTWALFDSTKSVFVVQTPLTASTPSSTATSSASVSTTSSGQGTTKTGNTSQGTAGPSPSSSNTQAPAETGTQGQPSTEQQSSGLSTGAQAGIGVGAAAGALLIGAVAYLWWRLRRIQAVAAAAAAGSQAGWHEGYPPPPAPSYYAAQDMAPKHELAGERETHELQGQSYYVQGDARSTEMSTHSPYSAVDSPLTTHQGVGR